MMTDLHLEPPVTIVDPKDDIHLERYVSEEIVLNCELSRSNGEAHWFKDGLKLQECENIRISAEGPYRRVTIICASKRDSGEYVCDTGGDSIFFQLILTGKYQKHRFQKVFFLFIFSVLCLISRFFKFNYE